MKQIRHRPASETILRRLRGWFRGRSGRLRGGLRGGLRRRPRGWPGRGGGRRPRRGRRRRPWRGRGSRCRDRDRGRAHEVQDHGPQARSAPGHRFEAVGPDTGGELDRRGEHHAGPEGRSRRRHRHRWLPRDHHRDGGWCAARGVRVADGERERRARIAGPWGRSPCGQGRLVRPAIAAGRRGGRGAQHQAAGGDRERDDEVGAHGNDAVDSRLSVHARTSLDGSPGAPGNVRPTSSSVLGPIAAIAQYDRPTSVMAMPG